MLARIPQTSLPTYSVGKPFMTMQDHHKVRNLADSFDMVMLYVSYTQ